MKIDPNIEIASKDGKTVINACIIFEDFETSMTLLNILITFLKDQKLHVETDAQRNKT